MYLIDQHAAHERALFEAVAAQRQRRRPQVQGLLEPLLVEVSPAQEAALRQQSDALAEHGFALEPFGPRAATGRTYLVRAVPSLLSASGGDVRQSLGAFLDLLVDEESGAAADPSTGSGRDGVAMSLACHGAIRAGKTLSMEEMRELVRQLEESEAPNTCPHGRPTMLHMRAELLAREFGRR
jgi:DNA mismatch repair protein MutL